MKPMRLTMAATIMALAGFFATVAWAGHEVPERCASEALVRTLLG